MNMDVLAAPKKIVDGLTEVFQGFAQMFEGVSEQLELLAACAEPEDEQLAGMPGAALPPDKPVPVDVSVKGNALPHPRKKPVKRGRKNQPDVELPTEAKTEPEDTSPDHAVDESKADDAENAEDTPGSDASVDTEEELPREDTGQKAEEPPDKGTQPDESVASDKSDPPKFKVPTLTKDDITSVIVAKIKQKRSNNEKIGQRHWKASAGR